MWVINNECPVMALKSKELGIVKSQMGKLFFILFIIPFIFAWNSPIFSSFFFCLQWLQRLCELCKNYVLFLYLFFVPIPLFSLMCVVCENYVEICTKLAYTHTNKSIDNFLQIRKKKFRIYLDWMKCRDLLAHKSEIYKRTWMWKEIFDELWWLMWLILCRRTGKNDQTSSRIKILITDTIKL